MKSTFPFVDIQYMDVWPHLFLAIDFPPVVLMTYFSICSLSCSRAKNWVSFLISLMAPFSSFLYLCFIFPFSFSSFDAAFFFFLSSNLNNKTNILLVISKLGLIYSIMFNTCRYISQTETYTSSILGSNIFRGLGLLCGILTCIRDLLLLSFKVFWRSFIDSCKLEHKMH